MEENSFSGLLIKASWFLDDEKFILLKSYQMWWMVDSRKGNEFISWNIYFHGQVRLWNRLRFLLRIITETDPMMMMMSNLSWLMTWYRATPGRRSSSVTGIIDMSLIISNIISTFWCLQSPQHPYTRGY